MCVCVFVCERNWCAAYDDFSVFFCYFSVGVFLFSQFFLLRLLLFLLYYRILNPCRTFIVVVWTFHLISLSDMGVYLCSCVCLYCWLLVFFSSSSAVAIAFSLPRLETIFIRSRTFIIRFVNVVVFCSHSFFLRTFTLFRSPFPFLFCFIFRCCLSWRSLWHIYIHVYLC